MKEFIVDKLSSGKKLFRFIQDVMPGLTNTEIFKMLRKEVIKLNGMKPDQRISVKEGDRIIIFLKNEHFEKKGKTVDLKFH